MFKPELYRLSAFYAVVNEGSLSRAAERLHMSQPAVSAHIKSLEQELGMSLFYRVGRRSVVNRAGQALYGRAEDLFSVADQLSAEMADLRGVNTGRVTIGASIDWQYRLPPTLASFQRRFRGVDISMVSANSERIEKLVIDRALDFGFIGRPSVRPELVSHHLEDDELVPICNTGHRLAKVSNVEATQLAKEAFIVRESGSAARRLTDELLDRLGLRLNIAMELGSHEAIKGAVMGGRVIGMVTRQALDSELKAGLLAVADIPQISTPMRMHQILHSRRELNGTQTAFLKIICPSKWPPSRSPSAR